MEIIYIVVAFVVGGIVGATVGYKWVSKQLASAKADLATATAKVAAKV